MTLTSNQQQLLENLKKAAREIGEHGKSLTSLIGELSVCQLLGLEWRPTQGYDALSKDGQKVQIKTRKSWSTREVNPRGRMGRFGRRKKYEFDQGVFVELNQEFEAYKLWQMSKKKIVELEAKEISGKGLHVSSFQRQAEKIWEMPRPQS